MPPTYNDDAATPESPRRPDEDCPMKRVSILARSALAFAALPRWLCEACATPPLSPNHPAGSPSPGASLPTQTQGSYRDPQAPIAARVADLLARMTLAEKIAQLRP